jgi:AGZA family xanthine/uracil permease-like MFS transporter
MKPSPPPRLDWTDGFFKISARDSTFTTEIRAGFATFFSLSYIFVLAPTLLAGIGLDAASSLRAVILLSSLATLAAGGWARLPFAFAPGLEMLLYLAFVAIPMSGLLPEVAVGCVVVSGFILFLLALAKKTHKIHSYPPAQFSDAVAISMSVFLLAHACRVDGLLSYDHGWVHIVQTPGVGWIWGVSGGLIALILDALGVPAPVLISVLLVSILAGPGATQLNAGGSYGQFLAGIAKVVGLKFTAGQVWPAITAIFTLLVLSLYGSLSKVMNLWQGVVSAKSRGSQSTHDDIPDLNSLMVVEGGAAIASGLFGISNITMFVESGAGIRIGGRTGIASIVTGCSMLSALLLVPYIRYINPVASVGALLYVGILFFPKPRYLRRISAFEWLIIGVMAGIIVAKLSLFWAFLFGLIGFIFARKMKSFSIRRKQVGERAYPSLP